MRQPPTPRRAARFLFAVAALFAAGMSVVVPGCGYDVEEIWVCLNPVTGKEDGTIGDKSHYVNGEFDPCHCYDPCGPSKECPIVVHPGPPGPDCKPGGGK